MNPCPHCGEPVLEMAKNCRHCGNELDEATFFLNEGDMVAEIMALQKEAADKEARLKALSKGFKMKGALSALCLLIGVILVATATFYVKGVGALFGIAGVPLALSALKDFRSHKALDS